MNGLSARAAAFLAEMGINPLWNLRAAPRDEPAENEVQSGAPVAQTEAAQQPPAPGLAPRPGETAAAWAKRSAPPPATGAVVPDGPAAATREDDIARMGWDELRAAIASCTRCGACNDGRKPVFGTGAQSARWLVAAGASTAADEAAGRPLAGDTGKLLDNMLFAVDMARDSDVYVTNLVKCRPVSSKGGERAPSAQEAAACRPYLERELALTGAGTVLTLGQIAANGLLGKPLQEPLAGSRGGVHLLRDLPLVATLHPGELLRRGADKALAWADLCRAKAARARSG